MFRKIAGFLYGSWWRVFVLITFFALLPLVLIYMYGTFSHISNWRYIWGSFIIISVLTILIPGISHIYFSSRKKLSFAFVALAFGALIFSFTLLEPFYNIQVYKTNQNYVKNQFESVCTNVTSGKQLVQNMHPFIEIIDAKKITVYEGGRWGYSRIEVITPTSELLQQSSVPYLYANVASRAILSACFWDKVENKPQFLVASSNKNFGSGSNGFKPKIDDNAILAALNRTKPDVKPVAEMGVNNSKMNCNYFHSTKRGAKISMRFSPEKKNAKAKITYQLVDTERWNEAAKEANIKDTSLFSPNKILIPDEPYFQIPFTIDHSGKIAASNTGFYFIQPPYIKYYDNGASHARFIPLAGTYEKDSDLVAQISKNKGGNFTIDQVKVPTSNSNFNPNGFHADMQEAANELAPVINKWIKLDGQGNICE